MELKIKTPRGTFRVERIFRNSMEAEEAGYYLYFTNDDGTDIYTWHIDEYHVKFGIVPNEKR